MLLTFLIDFALDHALTGIYQNACFPQQETITITTGFFVFCFFNKWRQLILFDGPL